MRGRRSAGYRVVYPDREARDFTTRLGNMARTVRQAVTGDASLVSEAVGVGFSSFECEWFEVNDALCELTGYGRDELLGMRWLDITHPDDIGMELAELEGLKKGNIQGYTLHKRILRKNSEAMQVSFAISVSCEKRSQRAYYVIVLHDIARQLNRDRYLKRAASVFEHARQGIFITDADNVILDTNNSFTQITGYSRELAVGRTPAMLKSGKHGPDFYQRMWNELALQGTWSGEICNQRQDGSIFIEQLTISVVHDKNGKPKNYIAVLMDVTPKKTYQQHLEDIAYLDPLTHLPNRSLLTDRLQKAMAQTERNDRQLAIVFMDLDGFKAINDQYGHSIGDRLLVTVADHLQMLLREDDTVARLGGDEFVVVVMGLTGYQECNALANRLLSAVAQPVLIDDHLFRVTASLGVTYYPQVDEITADQLLRQADQAMYQAKLAGKNRFSFFDIEQDLAQSRRQEAIERIRLGLQQGEFIVHYQPQVNMRSGHVIGAEALVRWKHPERGVLAPGEFLPLIEDHPLIADLGDCVINTVLTQLDEWRSLGHALSASVNVSAYQLQQPDFFDRLTDQLSAHPDFVPGELEIEVLETSVLQDMDFIATLITACESVGVSCTLDDFGTGYSSLIYLRHLPARRLKIDKCFVQGMLDDPDDLAILDGVLGLARAFRRQVIAEGVETLEHGEWLLKLGCEIGQGYGIAKPMNSEAFENWLASWQPYAAWRQQASYDRDDMPVLFAGVEYRAWMSSVDAFISGQSAVLPDLEPNRFRFGEWLLGERRLRSRDRDVFDSVLGLHDEILKLTKSLVRKREASGKAVESEKRAMLAALQDALVNTMLAMVERELVHKKKQSILGGVVTH